MKRDGKFNGYFSNCNFTYELRPPCFIMTTCAPNIINDCTCFNCEYSLDVSEYLFLYNRRIGNVDDDDRVLCKPIIFPCVKRFPQYLKFYTPRDAEVAAILLINVEFEFIENYLYYIQRYPLQFYKAADARINLAQDHCNTISPIERRSYYCFDCDRKYCIGNKVNSDKIKSVALEESYLLSLSMYYQVLSYEEEIENVIDERVECTLIDDLDAIDIKLIKDLINGKFSDIFQQLLLKFQNLLKEYMRVRMWFKPVMDTENLLEILLKEYYIGRGVKKKIQKCKF